MHFNDAEALKVRSVMFGIMNEIKVITCSSLTCWYVDPV